MAFEGSDAGASPNEAITWGKIKLTANPVKVEDFYFFRVTRPLQIVLDILLSQAVDRSFFL